MWRKCRKTRLFTKSGANTRINARFANWCERLLVPGTDESWLVKDSDGKFWCRACSLPKFAQQSRDVPLAQTGLEPSGYTRFQTFSSHQKSTCHKKAVIEFAKLLNPGVEYASFAPTSSHFKELLDDFRLHKRLRKDYDFATRKK